MHKTESMIFLTILIFTIPIFLINSFNSYNVEEKKKKFYPGFFLIIFYYSLNINAVTLAAITEKIYENGIVFLVIFLGVGYSKVIFAKYFVPNLAKFYNCKSVGDILSIKYGKFGKFTSGVASLLCYLGDLACCFFVTGKLLEAFFIVPIHYGAIIAAILAFCMNFFQNIIPLNTVRKVAGILFLGVLLLTLNQFFTKLNLNEILQSSITQINIIPNQSYIEYYLLIISLFVILSLTFISPNFLTKILKLKNSKSISKTLYYVASLDFATIFILGAATLVFFKLFPTLDPVTSFYEILNYSLSPILKKTLAVILIITLLDRSTYIIRNCCKNFLYEILVLLQNQPNKKNNAKIISFVLIPCALIVTYNFASVFDIWIKFYSLWICGIVLPLSFAFFDIFITKRNYAIAFFLGILTFYFFDNLIFQNFKINSLFIGVIVNLICFLTFAIREEKVIFKWRAYELINNILKFWIKKKQQFILNKIEKNNSSKNSNSITRYIAFALYSILCFIIPEDIWYSIVFEVEKTDFFYYKLLAIILSFIPFVIKNLITKYTKILSIYWYVMLTYSLPFLTTLIVLDTNISAASLTFCTIIIFLTTLLFSYTQFIFINIVGISLGYLYYTEIIHKKIIIYNENSILLLIFIFIFAIVVSSIFLQKEYINEQMKGLLEKKVKERTQEINNSLITKKEILNNISHEIRTPLQGILGISSELVKQWNNFADQEKLDFVKQVFDNGSRLLALISDLLDLSKFDSGKMILAYENSDIKTLINEIIYESKGLSIGKDISIVLIDSTNMPLKFLFDTQRITQVIRNLISNAIKFMTEGVIKIQITSILVAKGKTNFLKIEVIDEGVGIPVEELDKIFNPFVQATRTKTLAGGTGLGLAICKGIIKAHRGEIWAENNKRNGARVIFTLPFLQENEKKIAKRVKENKLTILFVDDEETCLTAGRLILQGAGHNVIAASGGREALEILKDKEVDLILLDLMMPDMYGLDVLQYLKNDERLKNIPVILQSGTSDNTEINKAYSLGAVSSINKPYQAKKMLEVIKKSI